MIFDMKRMVVELEYRGIVPVEDAVGARIDCLRGRIWITERGCAGDIVLEAGQSHEISRGGVAVVQALREEALVAFRVPVPRAGAGLATPVEQLWSSRAARAVAAVQNSCLKLPSFLRGLAVSLCGGTKASAMDSLPR